MTKQIERAYRSNRRRSWLLIAAVVALAAVAIPLANGAPSKPYTFVGDALACGSFDVTLTNESKTQTIGSADLYAPSNVTVTSYTVGGVTTTIPDTTPKRTLPDALESDSPDDVDEAHSLISLRNVLVATKGGSLKVTVTVSQEIPVGPGITAVESWYSIAKQANSFNPGDLDTSNAFSIQGPNPTVTVAPCTATIKGQIWNDSNENQSKDTFEDTQRPPKLSVVLKVLTGGVYVPTNITPTYDLPAATSETQGYSGYTFSGVPTGKNYVVCEEAGTGTTETWKQTTGSPQGAVCGSALPNGWAIANLSGDVTQQDFGNANTVTITCPLDGGSPDSKTIENNDTRYTVKVSGSTCKNGVFVLEAYSPDATKRVANFHPVGTGISTKIELIEKMEWRFSGTDQPDPAGRSLKYDDDTTVATGGGLDPLPMPYCLRDPRTDDWVLGSTANVLPTVGSVVATSCLLKTIEMTVTNPDATPKPFNREDWIYSSVDGYRAFP